MKKVIIASILVVGLATGIAYAHNNNSGMGGYGGHMMGNFNHMVGQGMMGNNGSGGGNRDCPGAAMFNKGGLTEESHQKFLKDTVVERKEMNAKRFDYMEAQRTPGISPEQLAGLEKEMIDLRTKLLKKAEQ